MYLQGVSTEPASDALALQDYLNDFVNYVMCFFRKHINRCGLFIMISQTSCFVFFSRTPSKSVVYLQFPRHGFEASPRLLKCWNYVAGYVYYFTAKNTQSDAFKFLSFFPRLSQTFKF